MNEIQKMESTAIEQITATGGNVLAERAKAEIQARYMVAIARPRNMELVRQKLLKECERDAFCGVAWYSVPNRGSGFSINFAHAAKRIMGNIDVREVVVFDNYERMIVEVNVTDVESNNTDTRSAVIEKTVERRKLQKGETAISSRINSYGDVVYLRRATDEEFFPKKNAAVSKIVRNLIIACVPRDFLDDCADMVKKGKERVDKNEALRDPDEQKRNIIDSFSKLNITVDKIELYLGHDIGTSSPSELQDLRDIFKAVRNGDIRFHELLEDKLNPKDEPETTEKKQSKIDKMKEKMKPKTEAPTEEREPGSEG